MTFEERFMSHVLKTDTCWLWTASRFKKGYGHFNPCQPGRTRYAHRISCELFKGWIPERMQVQHTCDNPPCVNPDHLKLGNDMDNARDKVSRRRQSHSGGRKAVFTEREAAILRQKRAEGMTIEEVISIAGKGSLGSVYRALTRNPKS